MHPRSALSRAVFFLALLHSPHKGIQDSLQQ
jgi:hypothetical protein